jgi:hypothetical protein
MTLSRKKFESEKKHEGAPFKPSFGLGGVVDLVSVLVPAVVFVFKGRVAHICPSLANVGNINVNIRGLAFV